MTVPPTMHDGCKMPMELVFKGRESSVPLLGPLSHCSLAPRSQDSAALKMSARCFVGPPYRDSDTTLLLLRTGTAPSVQRLRGGLYDRGTRAQYQADITGGGPSTNLGPAQPLSKKCQRQSGCDMKLATNQRLVPKLTMGGGRGGCNSLLSRPLRRCG
jgi:hypothetical protein